MEFVELKEKHRALSALYERHLATEHVKAQRRQVLEDKLKQEGVTDFTPQGLQKELVRRQAQNMSLLSGFEAELSAYERAIEEAGKPVVVPTTPPSEVSVDQREEQKPLASPPVEPSIEIG